jgi:transcriptional regulator GlxA family with amidase domain
MDMIRRTVAILIFEDVELLDFAGPYEVFSAVSRQPDRIERLLEVFTVAESIDPITCRNGLVVQPAYTLATCPPFEVLVVPGGQGTRTAVSRVELIDWIKERKKTVELITSVCTGSFLLAKAGMLNEKPATTHWGSIERMRKSYPRVEVREDVRWVEVGDIVTSAGVSAGIDMALHVVTRLYGEEISRRTARWIEYDYWR